jgi:hypothetical protein
MNRRDGPASAPRFDRISRDRYDPRIQQPPDEFYRPATFAGSADRQSLPITEIRRGALGSLELFGASQGKLGHVGETAAQFERV